MNGPLFSIITVCFNSEKTIRRTIESILNQTYQDFEYVIVDGQSTDKTVQIIEEFARKDHRIRFISEPDDGIYFAMNKGLKMASGQLICLLNSDDWFELGCLESIRNAYSGNTIEIVYGGQRTITEGIEELCVFYNHRFLEKHMICHQAAFVTRDTYDEIGLFDTSYKSAADYDFMLRAFYSGKVLFTPVHEVLVNFSAGGMSYSCTCGIETNEIKYKNGLLSNKAKVLKNLYIKLLFVYYKSRKRH